MFGRIPRNQREGDTHMATTAPHDDLRAAEQNGHDLLDRALSLEGTLTLEEAVRLHRAIGWPPPQLEQGVLRPPTAEEITCWNSTEPSLIAAMDWPEMGVEIEYRSPAIFGALAASARQAVGALRALASGTYPAAIDPSQLELERILSTGDASAAELARAHGFLGWDAPRFVRGCLQAPTVNGVPVADVPIEAVSAIDAWRGKIAPLATEAS